ncbi:MAG TPA: PhnD/SsuA/transferrin family substrate-binding protein [Thiobacillaceae bacterium]|nr:PhnD/SsuA/transferrin family substrate-binding protein [Thiobacillaceae bacterium]HNA81472.1 PhnD/SsuA/transferrin family substrate-binding protein [Thiobacillaceae bacterium]HNF88459.1 PhnD/SsuA/transferrin family substrate-binding protein [Thiobacillaceae bacterium]HNH87987.1 PhnD/SsuA/transferrin family substrate-binding protein [Thiobacillaceae bacterium]HNI06722.1 PhnD/SsuA/transferrin family substrate-binding protein [Thiobacillaceae bacterium]
MRWLLALIVMCLGWSAQVRAELILNVTLDYDQERDHVATQNVFNDLARALTSAVGQPVKLIMTQNAERVGERIRTGTYSMLLAPAQLVGLAMRNGYTPVAKTEKEAKVVLVTGKGSAVKSLETARGRRIALPHAESLVSYMVRGELNALGLSPSTYFSQVMHMNQYGAVLYALEIGQADLVAMKEDVAKDWIARNPGATIVKTLAEVPQAGVVVSDKVDAALRDRIRSAFTGLDKDLESRLNRARLGAFDPADKHDFEYVSTRGFYSPEVLPGANVVTAEQVKKLMGQSVPLFDVRPAAQYREAHIPGAVNLTYVMNSPKEVDYDDSVDGFDVSKLPKDKNAPMIFQCNGAECWYSYKAARYMVKRGYTKIYWFRTGLPAWKAAGYAVQSGA